MIKPHRGHGDCLTQEKRHPVPTPVVLAIFAKKGQERMERIKLSRSAKRVLRLLDKGVTQCPTTIPKSIYVGGALELQRNGLAYVHQEEKGDFTVAHISYEGRYYVLENPRLLDPVDWKWVIPTTLTAITAVTTLLLLFVACGKM